MAVGNLALAAGHPLSTTTFYLHTDLIAFLLGGLVIGVAICGPRSSRLVRLSAGPDPRGA
jgi:hypothetical protein